MAVRRQGPDCSLQNFAPSPRRPACRGWEIREGWLTGSVARSKQAQVHTPQQSERTCWHEDSAAALHTKSPSQLPSALLPLNQSWPPLSYTAAHAGRNAFGRHAAGDGGGLGVRLGGAPTGGGGAAAGALSDSSCWVELSTVTAPSASTPATAVSGTAGSEDKGMQGSAEGGEGEQQAQVQDSNSSSAAAVPTHRLRGPARASGWRRCRSAAPPGAS